MVVSVLGIALVGGAAVALPPTSDGISKLTSLVQTVDGCIASVKELLKRSQRESTALRTSCIEDKLKELEQKKTEAQRAVAAFGQHNGDPAGQQKVLDDSIVIDIYSAALVRDARNCKDATTTQIRLEVEYSGSQAPAAQVPGFDPVPPVSFQRPPLATPF